MNMDSTTIGAIIGAVALLAATGLTIFFSRNKNGDFKHHIGTVSSGRDSYVASGSININKNIQGNRLISKECSALVTKISQKEITDEGLWLKWNAFDVKFTSKCVIDTHRGYAFDGDAFQAFKKAENDQFLGLSGVIYAKCCIEIGNEENEDYIACNKLAQIYTNARIALRAE